LLATIDCVSPATTSRSATLVVLARAHLTWMGVVNDPYAQGMLRTGRGPQRRGYEQRQGGQVVDRSTCVGIGTSRDARRSTAEPTMAALVLHFR
jgi:hypothetical protein